jgi:hypothetical protein
MAREHAQIKLAMWADDDIRALSPRAQHLYFVLTTSPTLSYCGVADWRPKRIAPLARGWTPEHVETAAAELVAGLYILIDEHTEEVLVRSFIRNDELMKQPRMGTAMAKAHAAVASNVLRGVVVHELIRLKADFPDYRGWTSEQAESLLTNTPIDPSTYPLGKGSVEGSPEGSAKPSINPPVNGSRKGHSTPTGEGPPTPAPTPAPSSSSFTNSLREFAGTVDAQAVTGAWVDAARTNGTEPSRSQIGQVGRLARELLAKNDPSRVLAAATAAGAKGFATIDRELTAMAGRKTTTDALPTHTHRDPKSGRLVER